MNWSDSTRERTRDIIDDLEDACVQEGGVAEVSPQYYEAFLALTDPEMEALARAVLNAQSKQARLLTVAEPVEEAPERLIQFAGNTLFVIAIGLARFDEFAQLRLYRRIGPEPEPDVHLALTEKIANASPVIEQAVRDFIRRQHQRADEPGAVSSATRQPPAPANLHGWKTAADPELDSARIWQLQLTMFPSPPRETCERMSLNWLAACQLHADGLLSFDPRRVNNLNEAQEAELELVGPLVAAGCDAEQLSRLLHGLRRPYQYRPGSIYLDWRNARWRLLPVAKEPNPPQVLADWLDSLKESGDRGQLQDIANEVAAVLRNLPADQPEPE